MGFADKLKKTRGNGKAALGGTLTGYAVGGGVGALAGNLLGKKADVLDISGERDKERQAGVEKDIAAQESQLQKMLEARPEYKGISNEDGTLGAKWKTSAQPSNIGALQTKLDAIKEMNAADTKVTAGQNFKDAQADLGLLRKRAFGTGPSEQAQARMKQAEVLNAQSRDRLAKDSSRQQQAAVNQIAQQGGLGGGSRERMAMNAQRNKIMGMQGLSRQNEMNNLQITSDDEAQRTQLQGQMPGMGVSLDSYSTGLDQKNRDALMSQQQFNAGLGMQKTNAWAGMADSESARNLQNDQFNMSNQIQDRGNLNNSNMNAWNTGMTAYGANEAANAQARSGNKGGFFQKLGFG